MFTLEKWPNIGHFIIFPKKLKPHCFRFYGFLIFWVVLKSIWSAWLVILIQWATSTAVNLSTAWTAGVNTITYGRWSEHIWQPWKCSVSVSFPFERLSFKVQRCDGETSPKHICRWRSKILTFKAVMSWHCVSVLILPALMQFTEVFRISSLW